MIDKYQITFTKDKKAYILVYQPRDDKWDFFLYNEQGEGMSMSEINLFDILDEHFKNNF